MKRLMLVAAITWLALVSAGGPAAAQQAHELRVGIGFGIGFLPFFVAEAQHMFEQQAQAAGAGPIAVTYPRFFPLNNFIGGSSTTTVRAQTILRNQPYGDQGTPAVRSCT